MAVPGRATVEDFDDDDPYAPYRPGQGSGSSGSSAQPSSSSRPAPSGAHSSNSGTTTSGRNSTSSTGGSASGSSSGSTASSYPRPTQRSSAADTYNASPSSGGQSGFPREGGDDEPLFGGRPFRDSHDPDAGSGADASGSADATATQAEKEHLYALLNVPTDASADQIKESYRSLAVVLHPDKHKDASRKSAAESRFREVQRAYEVLSDPEKRAVYDYFGEEGLKSTWTVSVRGRSPQDMQAEFERERRRKQAADAEALVKSKGDFTAHVDASALFAHHSRVPKPKNSFGPVTWSDRINRVGCTQLVGKHGFETQVTNQTSVTFSGQMVSRNGMGGGNLVGTVKTHWSPRLFTDVTMSFLRPQIVTTKGQYTLDANSFFSWQGTLQTLMVPPSFNVTYGQRLSSTSTLTGFTSVRSGTYNLGPWGRDLPPQMLFRREPAAVSVGLTKQSEEGKGWTVQTSISPVDQNISVDWATKVLSGVKVRTGFNIGTGSGVSAFSSAERRVTENVRVSLGVNCSIPAGGVSLRIKVNRLGQKILLPITLSPEFRSDLVVLFTAVPAAAYTALHYGYFEPRKRKRLSDRLGELRRENKEMILERRQGALEALVVLRDQAVKKAELEMRKSGLVILEAWYGKLDTFPVSVVGPTASDAVEQAQRIWQEEKDVSPDIPDSANSDEAVNETYWNVRIPMQALVNRSQVIVPGNRTKANLLGFHDPVLGERKHLFIRYLFRGVLHQVVVEDLADLAIPMRLHQL
ncbi:hypothetical protein BCV70DRAFT_201054 [Testicularia cyperi]|uniref:J domain-containing protein n=1 Tax=Testicularia cyperi TaxID=1882483 RepID=A0A317XMF9_9BASI|nr:hypothetical protein BCV70DRAFT_201054 [Testicularia cyperi]